MNSPASKLSRQLAQDAEGVCRHYLPNGRRQGRYWIVGDTSKTPERNLYVRLDGPSSGRGAAGKWAEHVVAPAMLRLCDLSPVFGRSSASAQHNGRLRGIS